MLVGSRCAWLIFFHPVRTASSYHDFRTAPSAYSDLFLRSISSPCLFLSSLACRVVAFEFLLSTDGPDLFVNSYALLLSYLPALFPPVLFHAGPIIESQDLGSRSLHPLVGSLLSELLPFLLARLEFLAMHLTLRSGLSAHGCLCPLQRSH